jgi:hypothetical protein
MAMSQSPALELRRSELMTLAALSDPEVSLDSIDLNDLARLRAIGVVEGSALTAGIAPIAEAVRSPIVRLRLDFLGPGQQAVCPGWMDGRFTVVAVPAAGGVDDVKVAQTSFLPARLAAFTGLGPRPKSEWSWEGDRSELDMLLSEPGRSPDFVPGRELRQHWRVTMAWSGGSRSLEVLDGGDTGLWLVRQHQASLATSVVPASTTQVWVALIGTLPGYDEIEKGSAELT